MKTIEFKPDGQPTTIPPAAQPPDDGGRYRILAEILPVVFHKLKNKLTPILGYAQILQSRPLDDFTRERLARIEKNTGELAESLNLLKDYFKVAPAPRRPLNLNAVLEGLAPEWQELARRSGARVVLELAPRLPRLPLDAVQIRSLLLAMADNAASALAVKKGPGGEIRLATRLEGPSVRLAIRDNGCGIREEDQAGIWTPFFSAFPGHAGLGLVICEKILANHGASCALRSAPGEFSEFEMSFPLEAGPATKSDAGAAAGARPQP